MLNKIITAIIVLLIPIYSYQNSGVTMVNFNYVNSEVIQNFRKVEVSNDINSFMSVEAIKTYEGPMTAYGPDCYGCVSGRTASGYYVLDGNIYYNDETYGNIRIVAADKSLPFGTIVRIKGLDDYPSGLLTIVLDRGSAIGFSKKSYFDLLYKSESETINFGCQNATYDILRIGY